MDYGLLPPEVNSTRLYAGPGAAPMMAAATAWDTLSNDIYTTAASVTSAVTGLAAQWTGPSATAMTTAAMRYQGWLTATAAQAEATANQARVAAAAFETAFATIVPPAEVFANRVRLAVLIATNFLGINTAAIAATEAEYAEYWAQDAAAMFGYQAASQAATSALQPFTPAPQVANPSGVATQGAAVAQAGAIPPGTAQATVASVPTQWLSGLLDIFAPNSANDTGGLSGLLNLFSGSSNSAFGNFLNSNLLTTGGTGALGAGATGLLSGGLNPITIGQSAQTAGLQAEANDIARAALPAPPGGGVAATAGDAEAVGGLSVPSGWATQAPNMQQVALAARTTPLAATAAEEAVGLPVIPMVPSVPLADQQKRWGRSSNPDAMTYGKPLPKLYEQHPSGG